MGEACSISVSMSIFIAFPTRFPNDISNKRTVNQGITEDENRVGHEETSEEN